MTTVDDVEKFLREFKAKMKINQISYLDERIKNSQALLDLEITPLTRNSIISELKAEDFSEGPLKESFYGSDEMWVFGKERNKKDIYIKLTIGLPKKPVICISFHVSEHNMKFPFKK